MQDILVTIAYIASALFEYASNLSDLLFAANVSKI